MSNARARTPRSKLPRVVVALVWLCIPAPGLGQEERDAAAAWGGGGLGALSGLTLGLVGGVPPCSLSYDGATCARVTATLGGLIGSAGGAVLAYHDPAALRGRLIGAGVGAAAGAALGLGARAVVRQLQPRDVATLAVAGAALGAVPVGAAVGLGAGLLVGSALWLAVPEHGLPETLALGMVGMALGGLLEWASAAVAASDGAEALPPLGLQLSVGL